MDDFEITRIPAALPAIEADTMASGFDMPSERRTGALLQLLAASKPNSQFLEIGTGTGLATAWLLSGMDAYSTLISVDADKKVSDIAFRHLGEDRRLTLIVDDASLWLQNMEEETFDLIFADAMPGKYEHFDLVWKALSIGGFYVIDDMLPQDNWPDGHEANVERLLSQIESRTDCQFVKLDWSSGIVLVVRTR
ncbi:MAG: methyltransferase domain-containing protein [Bacteroidetes bacterium SB0662_bin_6]|nr:methyltransferase domain-containing protein [Bacteroidetes bacterium SB0668_bin_1]MYE04198.1 methyltransferase domain-containing protein [Bacteroidetes bacterium SB0662_bin_6]